MRHAIRIARIGGIDLRIDQSWFVIFLLVAWSLASTFAHWHPHWTLPTTILTAVGAAVLFFASVLAHELAHSLAALAYGLPVRNITLHLFGGVSNIEREPPSPGAELVISIVGPLTSFALGAFMTIAGATIAAFEIEDVLSPIEAAQWLGPLPTLLLWLGPVNATIGLFNLLPGLPLDGGRILRAVLWKLGGDVRAATKTAAVSGQVLGWLFVIAGAFMMMGLRVGLLGTGFGPGLWAMLLGWFLRSAAASSFTTTIVEELLDGVRVQDLMRRNGPWLAARTRLADVTDRFLWWGDEQAYPVFDGSAFVGVLSAEAIRRVHPSEWPTRTVADAMAPGSSLVVARPTDPLIDALRTLHRPGMRELPVVRGDGVLLGMLYEHDVMRWLELRAGDSWSWTSTRMQQPVR